MCGNRISIIKLIGFIIIVFVIAACVIFAVVIRASARDLWPTVAQIETGLSAKRGAMLPKQFVTPDGRVFSGYYVGASAKGNGRYSVEIQLTR